MPSVLTSTEVEIDDEGKRRRGEQEKQEKQGEEVLVREAYEYWHGTDEAGT
jgi:hypothetical protein